MEIALAAIGLALLAKNNAQSSSMPHDRMHDNATRMSNLHSTWVLNSANGEGIPMTRRFERQTPSHLYSSLGSDMDDRARQRQHAQILNHLPLVAPQDAWQTYSPSASTLAELMHDDLHASSLQKQIKSGELKECKSTAAIDFEMWNSRHRDDPVHRKLLCGAD